MARPLLTALLTSRGRYALGARHPRAQAVWRLVTAPLSLPRARRERRLREAYVARHGRSVRRGPFAGLTYPESRSGDRRWLVTLLLGAFERELHASLEDVIERGFAEVVNIGSAGGYYAIGLARALPAATVHAFEDDPVLRLRTSELALANGVSDRVHVHGHCDVAALRALDLSSPFVICDCEGCEVDLLDPDAVPYLRSATLLVELHELLRPGATDAVLSRFVGSHGATLIDASPRDPAEYEELRDFPAAEAAQVLDELRRGPMQWAYLTPQRTRSTG